MKKLALLSLGFAFLMCPGGSFARANMLTILPLLPDIRGHLPGDVQEYLPDYGVFNDFVTTSYGGFLATVFATNPVAGLNVAAFMTSTAMVQRKVELGFSPTDALQVLQNGKTTDEFLADKAGAEEMLNTHFSSDEEAAIAILRLAERRNKAWEK